MKVLAQAALAAGAEVIVPLPRIGRTPVSEVPDAIRVVMDFATYSIMVLDVLGAAALGLGSPEKLTPAQRSGASRQRRAVMTALVQGLDGCYPGSADAWHWHDSQGVEWDTWDGRPRSPQSPDARGNEKAP